VIHTVQFSGAEPPSHRFVGATSDLIRAAAQGRGLAELANEFYGTPDYLLIRVAFHEAGHAAIARSFGEAYRIELFSPGFGVCHHWRVDGRSPSEDAKRSVALAGSLAEHLAHYGHAVTDADLQFAVHPDALSDSDRINAGTFTPEQVRECVDLVRQEWPEIVMIAALLHDTFLPLFAAAPLPLDP
jgi:hypothetical protein